jgi:hypothetical protein
MAQLQFDATQVKPQEALEAIPKGWYNLRIVESEAAPTKDNTGGYLKLAVEVIDGQFANRKVFDRVNLWNSNPVAVEIAQRRLSAYCHATGVMNLQDSSQLHGIPFKGLIVINDKDKNYEPSNEIKGIKNINDPTASTPPAAGFASPNTFGQPGGFTPPQGPANPGPAAFQQQQQPPAFTPPQQQVTPWQQPGQSQPGFTPPQQPPFAQQQQQQQFAPPQQPQAGPVPPWAKK